MSKKPVMRRPVGAGDAAAIHRKRDIQILHADVVHDLIEAALQKRRVDGRDGFQAFAGHAARKT